MHSLLSRPSHRWNGNLISLLSVRTYQVCTYTWYLFSSHGYWGRVLRGFVCVPGLELRVGAFTIQYCTLQKPVYNSKCFVLTTCLLRPAANPFSTALYINLNGTLLRSNLSPQRERRVLNGVWCRFLRLIRGEELWELAGFCCVLRCTLKNMPKSCHKRKFRDPMGQIRLPFSTTRRLPPRFIALLIVIGIVPRAPCTPTHGCYAIDIINNSTPALTLSARQGHKP